MQKIIPPANPNIVKSATFVDIEKGKSILVKNKIEKSRLKADGKGPDEPVPPNTTEESRRKNRREELV